MGGGRSSGIKGGGGGGGGIASHGARLRSWGGALAGPRAGRSEVRSVLQVERHAAASAAAAAADRADGADRALWPWGCARRPAQVGGRPPASCAARCCWSWLTLEVQLPGSQHSPHRTSACRRQACGARTAACAGEAGRLLAERPRLRELGRFLQAARRAPNRCAPTCVGEGVKNNLLAWKQKEARPASAPDPHDQPFSISQHADTVRPSHPNRRFSEMRHSAHPARHARCGGLPTSGTAWSHAHRT